MLQIYLQNVDNSANNRRTASLISTREDTGKLAHRLGVAMWYLGTGLTPAKGLVLQK